MSDSVYDLALDSYLQGAKDIALSLAEVFADAGMTEAAQVAVATIDGVEEKIAEARKRR